MWNDRYSEPGFAYGADPNDFLVEEAAHLPPQAQILCLAEGEGRNGVFLATQGHQVTGVDGSAVGLAKAQALARAKGVEIHTEVADLGAYDLGVNKWDAIVSIWCHLPQPLRARVHAAAVSALKPGGVLLLEAYTPRQLAYGTGGPQVVAMLMEPADLMQELDGLVIERCEERVREIHEGRYHEGPSAVVQLRARRP